MTTLTKMTFADGLNAFSPDRDRTKQMLAILFLVFLGTLLIYSATLKEEVEVREAEQVRWRRTGGWATC